MIEIHPERDDETKLLRGLDLRCGIGRMPPEHAVETARELDYTEMFVDSDPGAEPFYLRLGPPLTVETNREPSLLRFQLNGNNT